MSRDKEPNGGGDGGSRPSGDRDVRAGRTSSGASQETETSSQAARRAEAAGHGTGGYGDDGEAPRRDVDVDVMQPRAEDLDRAAERRAERTIALVAALVPLSAIAYTVVFFTMDTTTTVRLGDARLALQTPLLGLFLGIGLMALGVAPILWAKKIMVDEEAVQEREEFVSPPEDREAAVESWNEGLDNSGFSRRALVRNSLLLGAPFVALPLALPLLSLGRYQNKEEALYTTNWAEGLRLVREDGSPILAAAVEFGTVLTVFPEGHTTQEDKADAATIVLRLRPGVDNPLPGRESWGIDGIVAYSKICTHAGCPVGLYEQQTHHLLCPCHQSTFLVTEHCRPVFGPAARPLPQLQIALDEGGFLVAEGDYEVPTGPSFWERA